MLGGVAEVGTKYKLVECTAVFPIIVERSSIRRCVLHFTGYHYETIPSSFRM